MKLTALNTASLLALILASSSRTTAWSQDIGGARPAPLLSAEFPDLPDPSQAPLLPERPAPARTADFNVDLGHPATTDAIPTSAQLGISPSVAPPYVAPYNYDGRYPSDPAAPLTTSTPGAITSADAGRLINGSLGGGWADYCGPAIRPCYHSLYGSVDAWWMHRNDATWKNLVRAEGDGAILARSRDPDFNLESIPVLTLGKTFCDWTLEGNVYYKDDIDAHTDASDFIPAATIFFGLQPIVSDYRFAQAVRVELKDGFHSYEFNAINTIDFFNWMIGVRAVEFREEMTVVSQRLVGVGAPSSSAAEIGTYNRMIGGQVGFRFHYEQDLTTYQLTVKSGFYHNDAHSGTRVRDFNNTVVIRDLVIDGQNEAYLNELHAMIAYNPYMWLTLRANYQVMYISEIALAPDQILAANDGSATGSALNAKGDMFMHGPQLGLELRW